MYDQDGNEIVLLDGFSYGKLINSQWGHDPQLVIPKAIMVVKVLSKSQLKTGMAYTVRIMGYYFKEDMLKHMGGHRLAQTYFREKNIILQNVSLDYLYSFDNNPF